MRVNNPTLGEFCDRNDRKSPTSKDQKATSLRTLGRHRASSPCGNFSDTSFFKLRNKEDRKADISALRPFTEGRSQGGSPPETTTTTTTTTQTTTTSEHNEILTSSSTTTATATITTTVELWQNEKNMEKPWETHLQTPLRNQHWKSFFIGLANVVKKKSPKKFYLAILLWCETYFFGHEKNFLVKMKKW